MTSTTLEEWDHWQALPLQGRQAARTGRRRRTRKPQLARISDSWEEDFSRGGFSVFSQCVKDAVPSEFSGTLARVLVSSWIPELWRAVGSRRTGFKKDSHPIPLMAPRHGQLWKKSQECKIIISHIGLCLFWLNVWRVSKVILKCHPPTAQKGIVLPGQLRTMP